MPYQLGDPEFLSETDMPSDADVHSVPLEPGDVIVMGSDGLFDNLWVEDIGRLINDRLTQNGTERDELEAQTLAERIAESAHANAKSREIRTPWAVETASRSQVSSPPRQLILSDFAKLSCWQWWHGGEGNENVGSTSTTEAAVLQPVVLTSVIGVHP